MNKYILSLVLGTTVIPAQTNTWVTPEQLQAKIVELQLNLGGRDTVGRGRLTDLERLTRTLYAEREAWVKPMRTGDSLVRLEMLKRYDSLIRKTARLDSLLLRAEEISRGFDEFRQRTESLQRQKDSIRLVRAKEWSAWKRSEIRQTLAFDPLRAELVLGWAQAPRLPEFSLDSTGRLAEEDQAVWSLWRGLNQQSSYVYRSLSLEVPSWDFGSAGRYLMSLSAGWSGTMQGSRSGFFWEGGFGAEYLGGYCKLQNTGSRCGEDAELKSTQPYNSTYVGVVQSRMGWLWVPQALNSKWKRDRLGFEVDLGYRLHVLAASNQGNEWLYQSRVMHGYFGDWSNGVTASEILFGMRIAALF
jgi:hypothetical protein